MWGTPVSHPQHSAPRGDCSESPEARQASASLSPWHLARRSLGSGSFMNELPLVRGGLPQGRGLPKAVTEGAGSEERNAEGVLGQENYGVSVAYTLPGLLALHLEARDCRAAGSHLPARSPWCLPRGGSSAWARFRSWPGQPCLGII